MSISPESFGAQRANETTSENTQPRQFWQTLTTPLTRRHNSNHHGRSSAAAPQFNRNDSRKGAKEKRFRTLQSLRLLRTCLASWHDPKNQNLLALKICNTPRCQNEPAIDRYRRRLWFVSTGQPGDRGMHRCRHGSRHLRDGQHAGLWRGRNLCERNFRRCPSAFTGT